MGTFCILNTLLIYFRLVKYFSQNDYYNKLPVRFPDALSAKDIDDN